MQGVRIIFCGHYHRHAGGFYKDMEQVVTSAWGLPLGKDKSGAYVVNVTEDSVSYQLYTIDDLPLESWCQLYWHHHIFDGGVALLRVALLRVSFE